MKYIIGNFKSNMTNEYFLEYLNLLSKIDDNKNIGIAPPSIFLKDAISNLKKIKVYAQDCEAFKYGSHTGRISYEHLLDISINNVIIGHSEQRLFNDNTNEIINNKLQILTKNNFNIILCIGESLENYKNNETIIFLKSQLVSALKEIPKESKIIIAYEPVWSIGTNKIPTLNEIKNVIINIKKIINDFYGEKIDFPILYGGSVSNNNINELLTIEEIDGFLIGNASLEFEGFKNIIEKCKKNE